MKTQDLQKIVVSALFWRRRYALELCGVLPSRLFVAREQKAERSDLVRTVLLAIVPLLKPQRTRLSSLLRCSCLLLPRPPHPVPSFTCRSPLPSTPRPA